MVLACSPPLAAAWGSLHSNRLASLQLSSTPGAALQQTSAPAVAVVPHRRHCSMGRQAAGSHLMGISSQSLGAQPCSGPRAARLQPSWTPLQCSVCSTGGLYCLNCFLSTCMCHKHVLGQQFS